MTTGIAAIPMVAPICFILTLPMNISSKLVAPINNAVDRFAGAISIQIIPTGIMTGKKPFLKSLITSCFAQQSAQVHEQCKLGKIRGLKCKIDDRQTDPSAAFI